MGHTQAFEHYAAQIRHILRTGPDSGAIGDAQRILAVELNTHTTRCDEAPCLAVLQRQGAPVVTSEYGTFLGSAVQRRQGRLRSGGPALR